MKRKLTAFAVSLVLLAALVFSIDWTSRTVGSYVKALNEELNDLQNRTRQMENRVRDAEKRARDMERRPAPQK